MTLTTLANYLKKVELANRTIPPIKGVHQFFYKKNCCTVGCLKMLCNYLQSGSVDTKTAINLLDCKTDGATLEHVVEVMNQLNLRFKGRSVLQMRKLDVMYLLSDEQTYKKPHAILLYITDNGTAWVFDPFIPTGVYPVTHKQFLRLQSESDEIYQIERIT